MDRPGAGNAAPASGPIRPCSALRAKRAKSPRCRSRRPRKRRCRAPTRKDGQAVAGKDKLAANLAGGKGIFLGNIADQADNVGAGRRLPRDAHSNRGSGGGASKLPSTISSNQARISSCGTARRSARASATAAARAAVSASSSSRSGRGWAGSVMGNSLGDLPANFQPGSGGESVR